MEIRTVSFVGLGQREFFDDGLDIVKLSESNGILGISIVTTGPRLNAQTLTKLDFASVYHSQPIICLHRKELTIAKVLTLISPGTDKNNSLPNKPKPPMSGPATSAVGAVTMINFAPPSFCSCSPTSPLLPSTYSWAPSCRATFSLLPSRLMATTRYPKRLAYYESGISILLDQK